MKDRQYNDRKERWENKQWSTKHYTKKLKIGQHGYYINR